MVPNSDYKTILLVDDNPTDLHLYSRALTEAGYRPITTLIGIDYFGLHQNERPALILLDRTLKSSLSAGTIAKVLRYIFPTSPIMLFSMSADALAEMDGVNARFLQKGEPAKCINALRNLLGKGPEGLAAIAGE